MKNKCYALVFVLSFVIPFVYLKANAANVEHTFFLEVTSVENPSFWGWDVGDYIPGVAEYDDANIPLTGGYAIAQPGQYYWVEEGSDPDPDGEQQQFHVSIDFGDWLITEEDDRDFGIGFPFLEFSDGKLSSFEWENPDVDADDLVGLEAFSFNQNGYLRSTYPEQYVLRGSLILNPTGSLTVTIEPPEVVAAGAEWRVDGGTSRKSGDTESDLTVGDHTLSFRTITGWSEPLARTVTISSGQTTTTTGTYTLMTGALTVSIAPPEVVAAGAQWRIVGESAWRDSGDIVDDIAVGDCTVEYDDVAGWAKPGNKIVAIVNGQTTTTDGTYVQQTGSLRVTLDPPQMLKAGAQWRVDSGDWQDSGSEVTDLSVGDHQVEYQAVLDWLAPVLETVSITGDQITTITRNYAAEDTASPLIVDVLPPDEAGIDDDARVPNNTSFSAHLTDEKGMDLSQADSIVFQIAYYDTYNSVEYEYFRNLIDGEVRIVKLFAAESDDSVSDLWVVYDKSRESAAESGGSSYPFDSEVSITVTARDKFDNTVSKVFRFNTETEDEHDNAIDSAILPDTTTQVGTNYSTIEVQSGNLKGVQLIYANNEPIKPGFGPEYNEVPLLDIAYGIGWPLNLQPSTVFNEPVTILIPCVVYTDVSGLSIYYYDGTQWKLACDAAGNVQAGGEGWIVPGSRKNYNFQDDPVNNDPSRIEIQVYHFSGLQVGSNIPQTGSLTMTITPQEAVDDGARWRVDGGEWLISGDTVTNLSLGSHSVEFNEVSGWTTPETETAMINEGQTATLRGIYVEDNEQAIEGNPSNPSGESGGGGGCFIGNLLFVFSL